MSTPVSHEQQKEYLQRWVRLGPVLQGIEFWASRRMTRRERTETLAMLLRSSKRRVPNGPEGWIAWQKVRERWMNKQTTSKGSEEG